VMAAGTLVGIAFNFAAMERTPNTFNCHRVIWLAEKAHVQDQVVEGLFQAYFVDGRDLSNREVLTDVAAEGGLSKDRIKDLLDTDDGSREVKAQEQAANELGVSGVPFFVFDDRIGFSGAQPEDVFLKAVRAAIEQRAVGLAIETVSECKLDPASGDQASC
jgi:predicted DsbA family dithiol-disulfide isomerase